MTEFIGGPSLASNLREYPGTESVIPEPLAETVVESVNPNEADAKLWSGFYEKWNTHAAEVQEIVARFTGDAGAEAVAHTVEVEADAAYL